MKSNILSPLVYAFLFYSRIPIPIKMEYNEKYQAKALAFLPFVGLIIGLLAICTYSLTSYLLPSSISILALITSMLLLTGALHEDGFADFCDGFGGGYTKEKILLT